MDPFDDLFGADPPAHSQSQQQGSGVGGGGAGGIRSTSTTHNQGQGQRNVPNLLGDDDDDEDAFGFLGGSGSGAGNAAQHGGASRGVTSANGGGSASASTGAHTHSAFALGSSHDDAHDDDDDEFGPAGLRGLGGGYEGNFKSIEADDEYDVDDWATPAGKGRGGGSSNTGSKGDKYGRGGPLAPGRGAGGAEPLPYAFYGHGSGSGGSANGASSTRASSTAVGSSSGGGASSSSRASGRGSSTSGGGGGANAQQLPAAMRKRRKRRRGGAGGGRGGEWMDGLRRTYASLREDVARLASARRGRRRGATFAGAGAGAGGDGDGDGEGGPMGGGTKGAGPAGREREIPLNDEEANDAQGFCDNYISTGKYNVVSFVPKFLIGELRCLGDLSGLVATARTLTPALFKRSHALRIRPRPPTTAEQFSKYANIFFLFTACIQQIPGVSPTNRYTTIVPLAIVLLATAFKEMQEDLKRHQADGELNARLAQVLDPGTASFELRPWKEIMVGDIVRVESNDFFPADLVLLSSSEPEGLCYVETANLDGETNLKIKQASPDTARLTDPSSVASLRGTLTSEPPNNSLYTFDATLRLQLHASSAAAATTSFSGGPSSSSGMRDIPLGPEQLLLRGAQLRNTPWVYGLVVFTGHETKLMRNATAAPVKRTTVEKDVNVLILMLFVVLLGLSIASAIGAFVRNTAFASEMQYLLLNADSRGRARVFVEDMLTFVIAYNNLIPISLIVMMEIIKYYQALLINSDLDMYHAPTDTPALCRTSSLVEELGQIDYIFSDKTGTLTRNEMEFKMASIGGYSYTDAIDESKQGTGEIGADGREIGGQRTWHELRAVMDGTMPDDGSSSLIDEFLTLLSVCHTVIPERKGDKVIFQASSPDEAALVAGAETLGYQFVTRKPRSVFVNVRGRELEYEVLNVCEFNSTRKRMSTLVRTPDGKIKLYCKGADTVIMARLSEKQPFAETTTLHLEDYATEGLRTLCVAMREVSEQEYRQWSKMYEQAAAQIAGRSEALDKAAEVIEQNLFLLGATAIEDKLQDGVPETIATLQTAGIKVWVLTGDRQETAINIGLSCKLISESMTLIVVNEDTAHDTHATLSKRLASAQSQRNVGEFEELALIIDGKSLGFALQKEIAPIFLELAILCKAVVCCRVSPLQKALVVKLVKNNQKAILLAIGDGANDVGMIQAAHVGVGISGVEGLQAARSADVAISQFRFLRKLLLVHGTWSYTRLSKMILYAFYKNIVLYITQFWYSFVSSFSGQLAFEGWNWTFWNVLFTVMPPIVIGIFDQHLSARMLLDRYPQLYGEKFFSKRLFLIWVLNAFYHSALCYILTTTIFWGSPQLNGGYNSYHWIWGTTLFYAVLV